MERIARSFLNIFLPRGAFTTIGEGKEIITKLLAVTVNVSHGTLRKTL